MAWANEPTGTGYSLTVDYDCSDTLPSGLFQQIGSTNFSINNANDYATLESDAGEVPHRNAAERLPVNAEYRRDEIEAFYKKDLELWGSL